MTPEERKELEHIRRERGRYGEEKEERVPMHKDVRKTLVWRLKLFGKQIEIRIS